MVAIVCDKQKVKENEDYSDKILLSTLWILQVHNYFSRYDDMKSAEAKVISK